MADLKVRVTKQIKEFIVNERLKTGLSEKKIVELRFQDELPYINMEKCKPKKQK